MESLGYGTYLTVTGFQASAEALADRDKVPALLHRLASELEPDKIVINELTASNEDGMSAALLCVETQLAIHVFPGLCQLSLHVFTRRDVPHSLLYQLLKDDFLVGRVESHLSNVGRVAPESKEELQRMLMGDRDYARARLRSHHAS